MAFCFKYKMNEIVNKFLLVGDKFTPDMHLKQRGFTYSSCGPFNKNKESTEKFMQTGNTDYIYKNGLDKACFNMMWLIVNIKIWLKEHNQIKFKR